MNNIRKANINDIDRLTEIYNNAILTKRCTCHTEIFEAKDRISWFNEHEDEKFPLFVYEAEGKILGYAYLTSFRGNRKALGKVCEISYYVDFASHGRHIGSSLMNDLIKAAKSLGYEHLVAVILSCNEKSMGLAKKFGFKKQGELCKIADFGEEKFSLLFFVKDID